MHFQDFANVFHERPCFTSRDAALQFSGFDDRQLHYWQRKGWLTLLRRPYYRMASRPWTLHERWAVANTIYGPSYISLESALGHYGFIPEGVFHITSISTRHTRTFDIQGTRHFYRNVDPSWFFGYTLLDRTGATVRMATPEKALLDLLHFNVRLKSADDLEALRLDRIGIRETLDPQTWDDHLRLSTNQALHRRARTFQSWLR